LTGAMHADAPMRLRPVRLEGRDAVTLSADRRTLYFRFYDYGHIDGVDFVTGCATRLLVGEPRVDGTRCRRGASTSACTESTRRTSRSR